MWVLLVLWAGVVAAPLGYASEVGALGYISPVDKTLYLVGTPGTEVASIEVMPHQQVTAGEVLMRFSNHAGLLIQRHQAALDVESQRLLGPERVALQKLLVRGAERQLERATAQLGNYTALAASARTAPELARREDAVEDARHQLMIERLKLRQIEAESTLALGQAEQHLALADAHLTQGELTAPRAGTVLEILKQVGESTNGGAAVVMADTSTMYVVCDVYESDLLKLAPGMRARVTSSSLPEELKGVVERVDRLVHTESRLGKVLIRLDASSWAGHLIGLEVHVTIQP